MPGDLLTDDAIARSLTRLFSWWRRTAPKDVLGSTALSALDALDLTGPLRVTDLATRERITQPGATAMVARLVAAGLACRESDPGDGRVALIAVTAAGRSHLSGVREQRSRALHRLIIELPAEDVRALHEALPALQRLISGEHR